MPWNIFINAKTVSYVRLQLLLVLFVTLLLSDTCLTSSSHIYNRSIKTQIQKDLISGSTSSYRSAFGIAHLSKCLHWDLDYEPPLINFLWLFSLTKFLVFLRMASLPCKRKASALTIRILEGTIDKFDSLHSCIAVENLIHDISNNFSYLFMISCSRFAQMLYLLAVALTWTST